MNRTEIKQLIRESFAKINSKQRPSPCAADGEEDPNAKWKDFCSLYADPGNKDFRARVLGVLSEDSEIALSVLEALDDDRHHELQDEIYRRLKKD
jgi:hypothetical protein